jgi:hypothetical protein
MMIACATREIRYAHRNNGDEAPRGWLASSKYWTLPPPRLKALSVGTGVTREEALADLASQMAEKGIVAPLLFETEDEARRDFLLTQAYRLARFHGIGIEYV